MAIEGVLDISDRVVHDLQTHTIRNFTMGRQSSQLIKPSKGRVTLTPAFPATIREPFDPAIRAWAFCSKLERSGGDSMITLKQE